MDSIIPETRYIRGDKAVGAYLGVTSRTVRNWMAAKILPYVKIGRVILFDRYDLDRSLVAFKRNAETLVSVSPSRYSR